MRPSPIAPQKVLIINIFGIGDVLFTTPLINNLKTNDPDVSIGYLCNGRTAGMLARNPKVERVFVYDRDDFQKIRQRSFPAFISKIFALIEEIKREGYDTSIDVSMNDFTGWLTFMARIRHRTGFRYNGRGRFLNRAFPLAGYESKHVVEYYLDLLAGLGITVSEHQMEIKITDQEREWAENFYQEKAASSGGCRAVGIVPGGGASWGKEAVFKRWPAQNYAKLADNLIENFAVPIILMGDKEEIGICDEVAQTMVHQPIMACGATSIGQFAALARQCALMIVNDGGPLHISVAAGVRTAAIFGPVDEKVYGPYPLGNNIVITNSLVCRPCYRRFRRAECGHISCLQQLTVDEVYQKVKEAL